METQYNGCALSRNSSSTLSRMHLVHVSASRDKIRFRQGIDARVRDGCRLERSAVNTLDRANATHLSAWLC
jgi:hypothetical protein